MRWAEFSNDFNPIHFNLSAARSIGIPNIAVHGMLMMLPLKVNCDDYQREKAHAGWQWKASLRQPILANTQCLFNIQHPTLSGKTLFSLCHGDGSTTKNLIGYHAPFSFHNLHCESLAKLARYSLPPKCVVEKQKTFQQYYPNITALWIFIDALIFSQLLGQHAKTLIREAFYPYLKEQGKNTEDIFILHTTHKVMLSPTIQTLSLSGEIGVINYTISVDPSFIVDNKLCNMLTLPVWLDGELVIVIEISLVGITV
ncbi:MaoC/PaaZ C-terminal domain-containing protein [Brenneria rubrifaciens]|nr:MaoC/PaaZ C-terminal domain-containing protein [Brenneria rubrifaciens]